MPNDFSGSRIIAFDFDGVIATYNGFKGKEDVQPPIPAVVEAIRTLKSDGHMIIIYSTRGNEFLKRYCDAHAIPYDYINENPTKSGDNKGKPVANVYVDDRAVCYKGQEAPALIEEILSFRPHWK